jgi:hypothetical protein
MRRWLALLATLVAGCAAEPVATADPADAALAACRAAVARHVGKPAEAVTASLAATAPDGTATVNVTDTGAGAGGGERLHTCEVDPSGRVRAILHPGA